MKTFEVIFDKEQTAGVYSISLVENPAIEVDFVALSKQEVLLKEVDKKRKMLIAPVLIPNKKILRYADNGEAYNIYFTAETIANLQANFQKNGYQNNSTIEHDATLKLSDVTFVETWIKEDMQFDKSLKYGFDDLPIGTWFAMMKVDNDVAWEKAEKGEIKGFSIDGEFVLNEVNLSNMNIKQAILDAFKELRMNAEEPKEVKLANVETDKGNLYFDGENLAVGTSVFADEMMETQAVDGDYIFGDMVAVVAGGVVTEVKEIEVEQEQEIEMSVEDKIQAMFDKLGLSLAQKIAPLVEKVEKLEVELSKQRQAEEVALTKAKPNHEIKEPTNKKERILQTILKNK